MKKLIAIIMSLFFITGCSFYNTPKGQAELFLNDYKNLNNKQIKELTNYTIDNIDESLITSNIEVYKRQYKNLQYNIINEKIDKNKATVNVKITVYNYKKEINKANDYLKNNKKKFMTNGLINEVKFERYILNKLKTTDKRKNYNISIKLSKKNGKWNVEKIDNETLEKIKGIY